MSMLTALISEMMVAHFQKSGLHSLRQSDANNLEMVGGDGGAYWTVNDYVMAFVLSATPSDPTATVVVNEYLRRV